MIRKSTNINYEVTNSFTEPQNHILNADLPNLSESVWHVCFIICNKKVIISKNYFNWYNRYIMTYWVTHPMIIKYTLQIIRV